FIISTMAVAAILQLASCSKKSASDTSDASDASAPQLCKDSLVFPYQDILQQDFNDQQTSFIIGDDGDGFQPVSDKIRYPKVPAGAYYSASTDSLLQYYNVQLALHALESDIYAAERYSDDTDYIDATIEAIGSINLSGIKDKTLHDKLKRLADAYANCVRTDNNDEIPGLSEDLFTPLAQFGSRLQTPEVLDAGFRKDSLIADIKEVYTNAVSDSTYSATLLDRVIAEQDFERQTILTHPLMIAYQINPDANNDEVFAIIDHQLRDGRYSTELVWLWKIWRVFLQTDYFSGLSNDSPFYNLFYNDMRNRVAITLLNHINQQPDDLIALVMFNNLCNERNICRGGADNLFGNNAFSDRISLIERFINLK
ncbi:MAG: hypothetical protein K2M80_07085, partial [Muribaculaceae bacterium]|nr:hypothetical protein [Muribaculaceae bacterium]